MDVVKRKENCPNVQFQALLYSKSGLRSSDGVTEKFGVNKWCCFFGFMCAGMVSYIVQQILVKFCQNKQNFAGRRIKYITYISQKFQWNLARAQIPRRNGPKLQSPLANPHTLHIFPFVFPKIIAMEKSFVETWTTMQWNISVLFVQHDKSFIETSRFCCNLEKINKVQHPQNIRGLSKVIIKLIVLD